MTVKFSALDLPALGAGLSTVAGKVAADANLPAGTDAFSSVEDTNVVVRAVPFKHTTAPCTNFGPVTVKVKARLPASIDVGLRAVTTGIGFFIVKAS